MARFRLLKTVDVLDPRTIGVTYTIRKNAAETDGEPSDMDWVLLGCNV